MIRKVFRFRRGAAIIEPRNKPAEKLVNGVAAMANGYVVKTH